MGIRISDIAPTLIERGSVAALSPQDVLAGRNCGDRSSGVRPRRARQPLAKSLRRLQLASRRPPIEALLRGSSVLLIRKLGYRDVIRDLSNNNFFDASSLVRCEPDSMASSLFDLHAC